MLSLIFSKFNSDMCVQFKIKEGNVPTVLKTNTHVHENIPYPVSIAIHLLTCMKQKRTAKIFLWNTKIKSKK